MIVACHAIGQKKSTIFIQQKNGEFYIDTNVYRYVGTNYWYGGLLYSDEKHEGKNRLIHELDFLQKHGITNLRVLCSAEGDSSYAYRIFPSLQPSAGVYNEKLLIGYDFLLQEAAKRKMRIVFVLTNNWEWSGGMAQYLEWAGKGNAPLPKTSQWDWDAYCNYIAQFYTCNSCIKNYRNWIAHIINRKNTLTGLNYKNDPTIMSWELANEPRPMKKEAIKDYLTWVQQTAKYIDSLDKNHLITIGVEGSIGMLSDTALYSKIHQTPQIDYATLHIWPKTWQWYDGTDESALQDSTLVKTTTYIAEHAALCKKINKPLVIEEFGFHRDGHEFSPANTTYLRNKYYQHVFETGIKYKVKGFNFWGYAGLPENYSSKLFMKKGMAYSADPPQEEQGLYSVFENDSSTCRILRFYARKIKIIRY